MMFGKVKLFSCLLILTMMAVLAGCSSGDFDDSRLEPADKNLVGTWENVGQGKTSVKWTTITFTNRKGEAVLVIGSSASTTTMRITNNFTWDMENGHLKFTFLGNRTPKEESFEYKISDSMLTLTGDNVTETYRKINAD
ncbi:MAG: hypothetical protein LBV07_06295 [Syntrophobacterales bacterium]|nr:hypothetical protein [Syntrophobacterales bacterium]